MIEEDELLYQKYLRKLKRAFSKMPVTFDNSSAMDVLSDFLGEDVDLKYIILLDVQYFRLLDDYLSQVEDQELKNLPQKFYDLPIAIFTTMISLLIDENDPSLCFDFLHDLGNIADSFKMTPIAEIFLAGIDTMLEHFEIDLEAE